MDIASMMSRPIEGTNKELTIWEILDFADTYGIIKATSTEKRTEFVKGLERMSEEQLGWLLDMFDTMDSETNYAEFEDTRSDDPGTLDEADDMEDNLVDLKENQLVEYNLGENKFTGRIIEVLETQAVVNCFETGNNVFLDFHEFVVTHDIDTATGALIDLVNEIEEIKLPDDDDYIGKVGDDVFFFAILGRSQSKSEKPTFGIITQVKDTGAQIRCNDTNQTAFLVHGTYYADNLEPLKKTQETTTITRKPEPSSHLQSEKPAWNCDFKAGDRVCFWDGGKKHYGTILNKRDENMYAIDVDDNMVTQVKRKWCLSRVKQEDDPIYSAYDKTKPEKKTSGSLYSKTPSAPNPHVPSIADKQDLIHKPVKPLSC